MVPKIDLAALAKARGQHRAVEFRPIGHRRATELELRRIILDVLRAGEALRPSLLEAAILARNGLTRDDARLSALIRAVRDAMARLAEASRYMVARLLGIEAVRFDRRWIEQVNATLGIDLRGIVRSEALAGDIDLATQRSVALIQGLADDVAKRVETTLVDMIVQGKNTQTIAKALADSFGFGRRRAAFIARDQAAKFNGSLNRIRQTEAGITTYIWWTVQDERVRGNPGGRYRNAKPSHWARHGEKFSWSRPPSDGHPGEPVNCRCIARPVLEID